MIRKPMDQSRKHARLLDMAVLCGMVLLVIILIAFAIYTYHVLNVKKPHENEEIPMSKPEQHHLEVSINTVRHVVSVIGMINNPPSFTSLSELNFKYHDLVRLRRRLLEVFGKDAGEITLQDHIGSISDKLRVKPKVL